MYLHYSLSVLVIVTTQFSPIDLLILDECTEHLNENVLNKLSKAMIPEMEGKRKGEAGKVAVIGGSIEYTGAPYFAAISALKVGKK